MFFHFTPIVTGRKPESGENFSGCYSGTNKAEMTKKLSFGMIAVHRIAFPSEMM